MNWNDIKGIVGNIAPIVGTALGGPAGAAIGGMVSSALGVDNTPDAVDQALRTDPDAALKLKKFELENDKSIREHAFKVLDAELGDKQSAREAHKHNPMPMLICIALTLMVSGGAYMLFVMNIPIDNKQIANLLFGTLLAKWGDSIAYWVGTTRASNEKTRMMR
tara:strand:+ start:4800 stop:5291 length:492 start_codon:yes stop_codon:yes gene_type:complete